MNKILLAIAFFALTALFTGCASMVVTDKNTPEPERSTLYLSGATNVLHKVDGKKVGRFGIFEGPKGTKTVQDGNFLKKELKPTAQIPSGNREITITVPGGMIGSNERKMTYEFLPGKKYRVAYEEPGVTGEVSSLKDVQKALSREMTITEITGEIPKE